MTLRIRRLSADLDHCRFCRDFGGHPVVPRKEAIEVIALRTLWWVSVATFSYFGLLAFLIVAIAGLEAVEALLTGGK